jgi:sigma-B regulation protein RsbU (phosphoserine phosphatase)
MRSHVYNPGKQVEPAVPQSPTISPETKYQLLLKISQQLSRTLELPDLLERLLKWVRSAVDYDAAGIFVLNRSVPLSSERSGNVIAGMALIGFDDSARPDDPMFRDGKGIIGHVIATGERTVAPDVSRNVHYVDGRPSTRSEITVPIVSGGQVIGALNLESDRLDAYTDADAELLEFFAVAAALSIEKALLHRQVLEKERIEHQLELAHQVQASLLPAAPPVVPGYDIDGVNLPTWAIGGDYFDYVPLADGRLAIVVADVAGKGMPAGLIMATFRGALRTELRRTGEITAAVHAMDRILLESMDVSRFVTAVYGVLDPALGTFTYVNCGHNPPLLVGTNGHRELLSRGRRALGMMNGESFEPATVRLDPGDVLALYTDGVVELAADSWLEFGVERLQATLLGWTHRPAREMIDAVIDATRAYTGRQGYDDDFTLVIVKREDGDTRRSSETPGRHFER